MYLNNYSEICTEPSPPFAPYPGQVLTLRYHIDKGATIGFIKSREGVMKVHTEDVVVEVVYESNEDESVYAFSFTKQDMGRPALYLHSKIGMLEFPFMHWEMKINDLNSVMYLEMKQFMTKECDKVFKKLKQFVSL